MNKEALLEKAEKEEEPEKSEEKPEDDGKAVDIVGEEWVHDH